MNSALASSAEQLSRSCQMNVRVVFADLTFPPPLQVCVCVCVCVHKHTQLTCTIFQPTHMFALVRSLNCTLTLSLFLSLPPPTPPCYRSEPNQEQVCSPQIQSLRKRSL